jgi:hypothetical protein
VQLPQTLSSKMLSTLMAQLYKNAVCHKSKEMLLSTWSAVLPSKHLGRSAVGNPKPAKNCSSLVITSWLTA